MSIFTLLGSSTYPQKPILEKLVCHRLWLTKEQLFVQMDTMIEAEDMARIDQAYHRYVDHHEPIEYILGYVQFAGLRFIVTPDTIIPRPETEYMIEAVRDYFEDTSNPHPVTLIDVGTGSWILGISTMYHESNQITHAYLTELSSDALEIARKNKETILNAEQQEKTTLLHCSLLDHPAVKQLFSNSPSSVASHQPPVSVLLVANLPYIPDDMFANNADLAITTREPRMAFVGGKDGLDLYRAMFSQIPETSHAPLVLFLEMMTRQAEILRQEYAGFCPMIIVKTFHANIVIVQVTIR